MAWIDIRNKSPESADVYIYDEIGFFGTLAIDIRQELRELDTKLINLHINSPGGSVFEGNAIYNLLRNHKAKVITHVDGIAASIASVIAMAGDEVIMAENSMMMIHDPSGVVVGDSDDMRKMADVMDKVKDTIITAYERKTNKDREELSKLMDEETWMTPLEAVALGFADSISEPMKVAAKFNLSGFRNAPKSMRLTGCQSVKGEEPKQTNIDNMKEILNKVKTAFAEDDFKASAILMAADGKGIEEIIASYCEHVAKREADMAAKHEEAIKTLTESHEEAIKATSDQLAEAKKDRDEWKIKAEAGGHDSGDGKSLLDEYNAITDPAVKTDFFRANKNKLIAEARKQGGK